MSSALLALAAIAVAYLVPFALSALIIAVRILWARTPTVAPPAADARVIVIVPAHEEGAGLVDCVRSLIAQDDSSAIEVWVMVADDMDSGAVALRAHFTAPGEWIFVAATRRVRLVSVGAREKFTKLNAALAELDAPLVAFLDADHRAAPSWISDARAVLATSAACGVQSRRRPLAASKLAQLWDAAENHVGNEAVNHASALCFFTGTTALFHARVFATRRFAASLTEDTFLSLDLIAAGERLAYAPHSGSYEAAAPDVRSFVARRRRWATGHTRAFAAHARQVWGVRERWQLLLYGQFYLVPLVGCGLVMLWAAHLALQLPPVLLVLDSGLAVVVASWLSWRIGRVWTAAFVWSAPQIILASAPLWRLTRAEGAYALLSFPESRMLAPIALGLMITPLAPLLCGWFRFDGLRARALIPFLLTYPLLMFVDVLACVAGAIDLLNGSMRWATVRRDARVSTALVPQRMRDSFTHARPARSFAWHFVFAGLAVVVALAANEIFATAPCGERPHALWPSVLRTHAAHSLTVRRWIAGDALQIEVTADTSVRSLMLDGAPAQSPLSVPLGWQTHTLAVETDACRAELTVASSLIDASNGLQVNGEPFLIKGVIPSFSAQPLALSMARGFAQIAELGANAVRLYHQPSQDLLATALARGLLVIAQPDDSTWNNIDLGNARDRRGLSERFRTMALTLAHSPGVLIENFGNELELAEVTNAMELRALLVNARGLGSVPLGYSTYLTGAHYPVDIEGINMLDTGRVYWRDTLAALHTRARPYYASELGGFTAFHERIPELLRAVRLEREWAALLAAGGAGACIYESHDNWAQPVPPGEINDPQQPEQPDDTRGLWDRDNQPKLTHDVVERMFADVEVSISEPLLVTDVATIAVRNRRAYRLSDVRLSRDDVDIAALGDMAPGALVRLRVPAPGVASRLVFRYTTHHGLPAQSRITLPLPRASAPAVVLTREVIAADATHMTVLAPSLDAVTSESALLVNGERVSAKNHHVHLALPSAFLAVENLRWRQGDTWRTDSVENAGGGELEMRFTVPPAGGAVRLLVLAGLGAATMALAFDDRPPATTPAHPYREQVFAIPAGAHTVTLTVFRTDLLYSQHVPILVQTPQVFSPRDLVLSAAP